MPTFKICVFKNQQRQDGRYRVSIRLTHNRQLAYLDTGIYVQPKQIYSDFKSLKDTDIVRRIDRDIISYEKLLLHEFGTNLSRFSAKELVTYIKRHTATEGGANIDFIAFSVQFSAKLKASGHKGYSMGFDAVIRALIDFFGRDKVYIKEINSKSLKEFAESLLKERQMTRINHLGKAYTTIHPPVKTQTAASYIGVIQTLFNAACNEYNSENEETALITHNPFRRQIVKVTDTPEKRNLSIEDLLKIIDHTPGSGREELARDVFLLSFYLIGMNTADLFGVPASALSEDRLTYKRQKTTSRRKDEALISIRTEPEVMELMRKYQDPTKKRLFRFHLMYANYRTFNSNINKGCKQLAVALSITSRLSSYFARHTWSTLAAIDCGISESDVGIALNHVGDADDRDKNKSLKVTRGYIGRTWEKIDKMNREVQDFVNNSRHKSDQQD